MIVSELNDEDHESGDGAESARPRGAGGRFVSAGPKQGGVDVGAGSGATGPPPSPTVTVFATTGGSGMGGGDLPLSTHANIKTILANQRSKDEACASIAAVGGAFPRLRAAVERKMGCSFLRARIEDFPAVVLAEAASELQSQMGAYRIL
jgi:hypothetical protein